MPKLYRKEPVPTLELDEIVEIMHGSWMKEGLCLGADSTFFFPPEDSRGTAMQYYSIGKEICAECPVSQQCLSMSLLTGDNYGLWGGKTPRERRAIDSKQRWQKCTKCKEGFFYTYETVPRTVCGVCHVRPERRLATRNYE